MFKLNHHIKYKHKYIYAIYTICLGIFFAAQVSAETLPFGLNDASTKIFGQGKGLTGMFRLNLGRSDPLTMAYSISTIVLSFLAGGFLVLLIYAGVLWVWARGDETKITKAKDLIRQSVIGLIIILSALGVSMLLFNIINNLWIQGY